MISLEKSVLVRSKFFEFGLEKLLLMVRDLFLVEDQNTRYIVVMNLKGN